jgi:hypothetical protein
VAERSNAAVLKTVVLQGTGGSNPSLSAKARSLCMSTGFFIFGRFEDARKSTKEKRRKSCVATLGFLLLAHISLRELQMKFVNPSLSASKSPG